MSMLRTHLTALLYTSWLKLKKLENHFSRYLYFIFYECSIVCIEFVIALRVMWSWFRWIYITNL